MSEELLCPRIRKKCLGKQCALWAGKEGYDGCADKIVADAIGFKLHMMNKALGEIAGEIEALSERIGRNGQ